MGKFGCPSEVRAWCLRAGYLRAGCLRARCLRAGYLRAGCPRGRFLRGGRGYKAREEPSAEINRTWGCPSEIRAGWPGTRVPIAKGRCRRLPKGRVPEGWVHKGRMRKGPCLAHPALGHSACRGPWAPGPCFAWEFHVQFIFISNGEFHPGWNYKAQMEFPAEMNYTRNCPADGFLTNKARMVQYNTAECSIAQYNTIFYNTIQYNTTQYSTTRCSTTQQSALCCLYVCRYGYVCMSICVTLLPVVSQGANQI